MVDVQQHIETARAIAIVRGNYPLPAIRAIADALLAGGMTVIEVTMNSAGVLDAIKMLAAEYGERMLIGAGTLLEAEQVRQAAAAGARFAVAPDTCLEVIRAAQEHGLEPIPGALTPSEIMQAHRAGARLIKLFPATLGGPDYLRQVCAPLDMIHFIPTGGIDASNARAYIDAGAVAVGLGSSLVWNSFDGSPAAVKDLTARVRRLMEAIKRNPLMHMA
jgi:2-dehydro-3-deoxyphosphogluconate aldolase/(4S)-4-hydroxy-2-oxoglutarate aldolase